MIERFEQYLMEQGMAAKTIESYVGDVRGFYQFLAGKGVTDETDFKRFYFVSYKNHLVENNYAVATINKKVNSLQAYNLFLAEQGIMHEQVVSMKRDRIKVATGSEGEVEVFSEEEISRLLFFVQNREKVSLRNQLIVNLLLYTGVRASELCAIKLTDIDYLTSTLNVTGKGGKFREIPLRGDLVEMMREYIRTERQESKFPDSEYLLVSQRAPKLHRDALNNLFEQLSRKLGFKMYPHKFRHTFCSRLIQKGVPVVTVSRIAGHANVQTTATYYVNTSRQDKLDAVNLL
jgi:integrase/recombinase XerD